MRTYLVSIEITAPHTTTENEIERAINAALDEPPCDWSDWIVGYATIQGIHSDHHPTGY